MSGLTINRASEAATTWGSRGLESGCTRDLRVGAWEDAGSASGLGLLLQLSHTFKTLSESWRADAERSVWREFLPHRACAGKPALLPVDTHTMAPLVDADCVLPPSPRPVSETGSTALEGTEGK